MIGQAAGGDLARRFYSLHGLRFILPGVYLPPRLLLIPHTACQVPPRQLVRTTPRVHSRFHLSSFAHATSCVPFSFACRACIIQFSADFPRARRNFLWARRLAGRALWGKNQRAREKSA